MMRGRRVLSVVLIAALLLTGTMRSAVQHRREAIIPRPLGPSRLSGMNTFTLSLVLGGLRGPLVMMLWTSIENQKIEKNIEDIDTKINWVRILQPEFDTVHIYQIWNKGYNLSVMMANRVNRYIAVLDALDYAYAMAEERPDNINILAAIADLYFNKLGYGVGAVSERRYYADRMRLETLPREKAPRLQKGQAGWRRSQHDVLLDSRGFILPALLAPRPNLVGSPSEYSGAELEFLASYNTPEAGGFPYGISPLALAYNYYKRCSVIQALTGQEHTYLSDSMIDSRAAVSLMYWAQDEWLLGRRLEMQLLNKSMPEERLDMEMMSAPLRVESLRPADEARRKMVAEAIFNYRRSAAVSKHSLAEFDRHLKGGAKSRYGGNVSAQAGNIDTTQSMQYLMQGDADYLSAMAAKAGFTPPLVAAENAAGLLKSAAESYQKALDSYYLTILKYYVDDRVANIVYPPLPQGDRGRSADRRPAIGNVDTKLYAEIYQGVKKLLATDPDSKKFDHHDDMLVDLDLYIARANARLGQIRQMQ